MDVNKGLVTVALMARNVLAVNFGPAGASAVYDFDASVRDPTYIICNPASLPLLAHFKLIGEDRRVPDLMRNAFVATGLVEALGPGSATVEPIVLT